MASNFLPALSLEIIERTKASGNMNELYDLFTQPLHEELYRRKTFVFLDELSEGQQLLVAYDYVRMQVGQGGFIQFIQNGYTGLLPAVIEQLYKVGAADMAKVLDDVLKVFVLNKELLEPSKTVEEFARLYDELTEFEGIDERFRKLETETTERILQYVLSHLAEFVTMASASDTAN